MKQTQKSKNKHFIFSNLIKTQRNYYFVSVQDTFTSLCEESDRCSKDASGKFSTQGILCSRKSEGLVSIRKITFPAQLNFSGPWKNISALRQCLLLQLNQT